MHRPSPTLRAALLAIGLVAAVSPALANDRRYPPGDRAYDEEVRAQETDPPVLSNGFPVIVGQDAEYKPIIEYRGPQTGNLNVGGIPTFAGNRDHGHAQIVYVTPAATATSAATTAPQPAAMAAASARRPAPPAAITLLSQASHALRSGEFTAARNRLERAETMLLNARSEGESGFVVPVDDIAAARAALARHDARAAQASIAAVQQALRTGS